MAKPVFLFLVLLGLVACNRKNSAEDPAVWSKVKLNFRNMDADGLRGLPGEKGAVNYEFCIPGDEKTWKKVAAIDSTAAPYKQSKGRSGCSDTQWLVIGSTHQKNYQRVLYELASLPFVTRITETFWE